MNGAPGIGDAPLTEQNRQRSQSIRTAELANLRKYR